jgi:hypothetical protein
VCTYDFGGFKSTWWSYTCCNLHNVQGARERERRLALSTALAKERVALGLHTQKQQQARGGAAAAVAEEEGGGGDSRSAAERHFAREAAQAEQVCVCLAL